MTEKKVSQNFQEIFALVMLYSMSADDDISAEELSELDEAIEVAGVNKEEVSAVIEEKETLSLSSLVEEIKRLVPSITEAERKFLLEAGIRMVLVDNYLMAEECEALVKLTELLNISMAVLLGRVAYLAAVTEELVIDIEGIVEL